MNASSGFRNLHWSGLAATCSLWLALGILARPGAGQTKEDDRLWESVRSGEAFVLMRHALAPGTGDPGNFEIADCATQRNLSEAGRRQAREIGERFRASGIDEASVFTSQWCRCRETAELLDLGPVSELPALNSFFQEYERRDDQTEALNEWLLTRDASDRRALVLVTHQVNITATAGVYPSSGEIVVCSLSHEGALEVLGRIDG
ncbi:histidine phosphatase family protein [Pelagicoccus sp. SDUM812002]|uniref:histidine phosphatase family protein n=1 Tax=Pelagicoccus sp. SDUM812002 TaxID=3041266 RepID=UPI00280CCEB4|nr:histidine phosphatase family protein [Pelagicoccus sp. SDUM812002]MDQ8184311.1 histidine phosphatase family protein [Pelagicoccus sp. SDUM812002]